MGLYENNNNTLSLLAGGNSTFYADAPIGSIYPYGGTTAPEGFLICDGSAVSRETYADLFAVIGTSFGSGDGSTTFNIPDLRGEFLRGAGTNSHSGQGNGGTVGQHQDGTEHTHAYAFDDNTLGIFIKQKGSGFNAKANNIDSVAAEEVEYMTTSNITKQDQEIHPALYTSRPTNTSVNYIIKATIIALPVDILGTVDDKIDDAIAALDVSSVGGNGKYISAISETDGKISATETALSTTPTSGSAIPITSGGVYTATQRSYVHRPFSNSLNVTLTPGVAGVYILFVEANPATMQSNMTGQLLKNSTSLTYNTVVNAGSAGDYSILSIFAIAEISATDTLRFVVTGATGDSSYNHYGYARVSM